MERKVCPGEFYRHFKNKLYQIITIASHSESGEAMVVYQALYGDYRTYVRPLSMFLEEVDSKKYPDVTQQYRFEQVQLQPVTESVETDPKGPHVGLMNFLEAETYEERSACLRELGKTAGQRELDSLYVVLDMKPQKGSIEQQIHHIHSYLEMQKRFDGGHLR